MTANAILAAIGIVALVLGAIAFGAMVMERISMGARRHGRHAPPAPPEPEPLAPVYDLTERRPPEQLITLPGLDSEIPAELCGARPEGINAPEFWVCTKYAGHFPHTLHETGTGGSWGDHTFTAGGQPYPQSCQECGGRQQTVLNGDLFCRLCGALVHPEHVHQYGGEACWCGWGEQVDPAPYLRPYVPAPAGPPAEPGE